MTQILRRERSVSTAVVVVALGMVVVVTSLPAALRGQAPLTLTVQADKPGPKIDPIFYGLMTEEINFSYDGGLYAELIRNRTFRDNAQAPDHWSVVQDAGGAGTIALDNAPVPDTALTTALKLDATTVAPASASASQTKASGASR